ncbi:MAG TPA: nucleoside triphosphate pyrophosphohydrolase [Oligoflexus sp.]|uniref:nucleoside triphosphate pyrophosphohydrolase n=1 Tax=Oligoflexus sp. TaxID=1971216 RepID=UPI002D26ED98|nr:nucleoside triphosphate pyrophosphohydrolase [Oligoflexus sp.]HYX39182.1 nucleoside triphosphate pyrophosphohydrolase [Oligoflexus sp.]
MTFDEKAWQQEVDARAEAAGRLFTEFVKTVSTLRHPLRGCPWDLEQDHKSLRRFMLEEAYEAAEAMLGTDEAHLLEELGDVLLQVVLNAQLAVDQNKGDIRDVVTAINSKMLRRHPHVFGELAGQGINQAEIKSNWDKIKAKEKAVKLQKAGYFSDCAKVLPALTQAYKIGKRAHTIRFDWDTAAEVLKQCQAELKELEHEMVGADQDRLHDELGDVFFSLAQLSRHLGVEPEVAAQQGNAKFLRRFAAMEDICRVRNQDVSHLTRDELEALWKDAKSLER